MKTAYEQLRESNVLDAGDTRWNRLVQLAESERRERVAESLVQSDARGLHQTDELGPKKR